jgi:hypothetical protein
MAPSDVLDSACFLWYFGWFALTLATSLIVRQISKERGFRYRTLSVLMLAWACFMLMSSHLLGTWVVFPKFEELGRQRDRANPTSAATNLDRDFTARPAETREDYWAIQTTFIYRNTTPTNDPLFHDYL